MNDTSDGAELIDDAVDLGCGLGMREASGAGPAAAQNAGGAVVVKAPTGTGGFDEITFGGVPPSQRRADPPRQVFGMFKGLHSRDVYPGTGVGLAIVHKVVQRHGGTVCIQDNPGGGSRLTFTIPPRGPQARHPRRRHLTALMKEGRAISTTEHHHPEPAGTAGHAVPILLVEDNPGDIRLTREALRGCGITNPMDVVTDGAAALAYLHREPPYHGSPRLGLILMDLNLPRLDGEQVLTVIRTDPDHRTIPVIILTTSSAPTDVQAAYQRHANCYIVKPPTFTEFARAINGIGGFWLDLVTLPPAAAAVVK